MAASGEAFMQTFVNPPESEIKALLARVRNIAVVGLSPKANRPSYRVAAALQGFGYRIIPVRPMVSAVLGETAYADLSLVPGDIDLVDVFRAPEEVGPVVDACIARRIPALWFQDGVVNVAEALRAQAAGITVIMDRCTYRDYVALAPHGSGPRDDG
jgi:predicted CoA-binding protein